MDVVARHLLLAADVRQAALAKIAFAARQHGGDDHGLAEPAFRAFAGSNNAAGDFMPECQRQRMSGANAVVKIAEVGVADAAAGDGDDHLAGPSLRYKRLAAERCANRRHYPAVSLQFLWHVRSPVFALRGRL